MEKNSSIPTPAQTVTIQTLESIVSKSNREFADWTLLLQSR